MKHALNRTSPKGGPFVGTCFQCGTPNLTIADMHAQECPNQRNMSEEDALVEAVMGKDADPTQASVPWPDPTPEMIAMPEFETIWQCIKSWDINVPYAYEGYCGATGNHVRAILDALPPNPIAEEMAKALEDALDHLGKFIIAKVEYESLRHPNRTVLHIETSRKTFPAAEQAAERARKALAFYSAARPTSP